MEKFRKYLLLLLFATISLSLTSCGGDDENEGEQPCFSLNDAQFSGSGGSLDCTIYNCNPYTSVQANDSWITAQMYDFNSGGCYISVAENATSSQREGVVELLNKGQVVDYLYVTQEAGMGNSDPGDNPGEQEFGAPTGLSLSKSGYMVTLTWNKVSKAIMYWIYYSNPTGYDSGYFVTNDHTSSTTFTMNCKIAGNWAFKVVAYDGSNYSGFSNTVSTYISESDINGGGGDGGDTQKPSAPTGVSVSNEGNSYIPDVVIRWNAVSNATYYYIYRSSSANGSYSKIGEMPHPYTSYSDSGAPTNGGSAYYKVKAVNSAGESSFSNYAKYSASSNDDAFAPAYTYGNCTVSGSNMTLRWTNSTGYGYGKATSIVLRVWNPYAEEWQDTNLSATATSATFNYSTKIDNSGYVKAGIVVSNAKGSYTAGAKIYDTKSKKWLN